MTGKAEKKSKPQKFLNKGKEKRREEEKEESIIAMHQ